MTTKFVHPELILLYIVSFLLHVVSTIKIIIVVRDFVIRTHHHQHISFLDMKQTAIHLFYKTVFLGFNGALTLLIIYLSIMYFSPQPRFNFWVFTYFPGCIIAALPITLLGFTIEILKLRFVHKYKFMGNGKTTV